MGMHEPGWRERNEERARERWDDEAATLLARLLTGVQFATHAVKRRDAEGIIEGLQILDAASAALFAIRHGPENPDA